MLEGRQKGGPDSSSTKRKGGKGKRGGRSRDTGEKGRKRKKMQNGSADQHSIVSRSKGKGGWDPA